MPTAKQIRGPAKKAKVGSRPGKADGRKALVSGAVPYQPKMTKTDARKAIGENLGQRVPLADYRSTVIDPTKQERDLLLDQAQVMLEQVYAHLPLKRAMYGIDPIQRLRLLELHQGSLKERDFQSGLIDIFVGLRDLHTNYILPGGYQEKFAFLPFRAEEFYEGSTRRFVVSWVSPVNTDRNLKEGVVITHWNGSPIELAVARNAEREAGSNSEARRAQGVEALTLRWFGMSLPPDEDWVTLNYTDGTKTYESRFNWEVIDASDKPALLGDLLGGRDRGSAAAGLGVDLKTVLLQRFRKTLFDAAAVKVEAEMAEFRKSTRIVEIGGLATAAAPPRADQSRYPDVFPRFGSVKTPSGTVGYVRLATFAPRSEEIEGPIREFIRILSTLPPTGLILDVRGNGGGYIGFGERILQLLTPGQIYPEPFHFVNTSVTLDMARSNDWLGQWGESIAQGIETGSTFSQGFPLTPPESCNDIGQVYQGPVVLITDALCYSTTDIFAAGFQDHEIGTIIGTQANTGAGGANVWDHQQVLEGLTFSLHKPFQPLPRGAGMRVAARRSTRLGKRSGVPLEDLGVVPDEPYLMTRDDALNHNDDLIAHAAKVLAAKEKQTLHLTAVGAAPVKQFQVAASNIDRVDLLVNRRPVVSRDIATTPIDVDLPYPVPAAGTLAANGYRGGTLVVSTRYRT